MSDQILSQEEIDALLSAMDSGEVVLEDEEKQDAEVKAYDLTSKGVMLREQFYALEQVYEKFGSLSRHSISSSLQRAFEVDFVSTEIIKFGDFLKAFSNPTSFNIFSVEPLIGSALLVIEPDLVFSLVDCMFGGTGRPLTQERDFTLIEQRMMRKFSEEVLENYEKAWGIVYNVKLAIKKTETKCEFVHMVPPNDLVLVTVFSISGEEFSGNIHFCLSYLMLEPIKETLSSRYVQDDELSNTWDMQLRKLLRKTRVGVVAELGRTESHTFRDLLNFREGDIIKLNRGPQDPVVVMVEAVPKYEGFPGVVKGNRAVQISQLFRQRGGS